MNGSSSTCSKGRGSHGTTSQGRKGAGLVFSPSSMGGRQRRDSRSCPAMGLREEEGRQGEERKEVTWGGEEG
jgi:hypothetical protein